MRRGCSTSRHLNLTHCRKKWVRLSWPQQTGSLSSLCYQETNRLVVQLFPRAADDVKLSLILECLPRLSVKRILASMSDSEKEVQRVIDILL